MNCFLGESKDENLYIGTPSSGVVNSGWGDEYEADDQNNWYNLILKSMQNNRAGKYKCEVVDPVGGDSFSKEIQVASMGKKTQ